MDILPPDGGPQPRVGTALAVTEPAPYPALSAIAAAERAETYLLASTSPATRRAYRSDVRHFATWCAAHRVAHLPASVEATAAYLAALADQGRSASTVSRRLAAIAYAHRAAGHEPPSASLQVRGTLAGIRRTIGTAQDGKHPATAAIMGELLAQLPASGLVRLRDRALLLVGMSGAMRRSELVAIDIDDLAFRREGVTIRLGATKSDQEGRGTEISIPNGSKLKPVAALRDWIAAAAIVEGAVFRRIRRGGRLTADRLDAGAVALIVKRYAEAAGLPAKDFAGHSLRAGFVTQALEDGADMLRVMDQSRHAKVDTLRIYDRRAKAFRNHAGKGFL